MIDSLHNFMRSERKATDHMSKNRAHYWQHLEIRQVQRIAMFKHSTKTGINPTKLGGFASHQGELLHTMLQR
ncbi:hypothetical protein ACCD10_22710 [Pseudomonas sp. Pseusp122]|uniref:hypothetical protein n=1 Tax=unclassified Pseudomonas TaxID=196821 RepID=UPI0039A709A5